MNARSQDNTADSALAKDCARVRESLRLVQIAMVLVIVAAALTIVTDGAYGAFGTFGFVEAIDGRSSLGRAMRTLYVIVVELLLVPATWLLVAVAVVRLQAIEVGRGGVGRGCSGPWWAVC